VDDDYMTHNAHPNPVSRHIGRRIALARKMRRLTQAELARLADYSIREVRSIERGHGDLTAIMLCDFGNALDTPVSFFFEGLPTAAGTAAPADTGKDRAASVDLMAVVRDFERIREPQARKHVLDLVRALADALTGLR
jgi:transcriptional regulator with XRE-family HTH domain